ncbi:MAG: YdeI/OmpD-associated family protein [Rhodobacteraceae bacterium]|nr:YdeI/OmpD-associated family protein [Paracoccaceae bacterium]
MIARAIAGGQWDALNDIVALTMPDDLTAALAAATATATATWDASPRCVKRGTLDQIAAAKTATTRAVRIAAVTVRIAAVTESAVQGLLRPKAFWRGHEALPLPPVGRGQGWGDTGSYPRTSRTIKNPSIPPQ